MSIAEPGDARAAPAGRRRTTGWATRLRAQRQDLYQRELLLDTVIQASPLALVLTNATGTILYANLAARQLLGAGRKLEGLAFGGLLDALPPALREALADEHDRLFTAHARRRRAGVPRLAPRASC